MLTSSFKGRKETWHSLTYVTVCKEVPQLPHSRSDVGVNTLKWKMKVSTKYWQTHFVNDTRNVKEVIKPWMYNHCPFPLSVLSSVSHCLWDDTAVDAVCSAVSPSSHSGLGRSNTVSHFTLSTHQRPEAFFSTTYPLKSVSASLLWKCMSFLTEYLLTLASLILQPLSLYSPHRLHAQFKANAIRHQWWTFHSVSQCHRRCCWFQSLNRTTGSSAKAAPSDAQVENGNLETFLRKDINSASNPHRI